MKISMKKLKWNHISLSNVYVISFLVMMIYVVFFKADFFLQTSLFSPDFLREIENKVQWNSPQITFLITERIRVILALFILSTTNVGDMYVYLTAIRYGICSGLFFSVVVLRYGIKGVLLLVAGMFPHYLIYVPALIFVMQISKERRKVNGKFLAQILVVICVVIIGCVLECYVNPNIVAKMLKKF